MSSPFHQAPVPAGGDPLTLCGNVPVNVSEQSAAKPINACSASLSTHVCDATSCDSHRVAEDKKKEMLVQQNVTAVPVT